MPTGIRRQEICQIMTVSIHGLSPLLLAACLLALMLLALEVGYRSGNRRKAAFSDAKRAQISAVLASMLGLLALILSFTFSMAMQRYEARHQAIVAEINAFGTAYLRTELLPAGTRDEAQSLLRQFLDIRIEEGKIPLAQIEERQPLLRQAESITAQLWRVAVTVAQKDPGPVTAGLFLQALNELFDSDTTRFEALDRHVPQFVLLLIFATSIVTTATLGYSSGIAGQRASTAAVVLVTVLAVVAFLILEMDRPRSGIFRVRTDGVMALQKSIGGGQGSLPAPASSPAASGRPPR